MQATDTRVQRREPLIQLMKDLKDSGKNCASCTGVCCTFVGNSMQITVLEAFDLYQFLEKEGRWKQGLMERLKENISMFRLDRPVPGDGRRNLARRRYTCPFFKDTALGCSIDPMYKPYGCLGFNALGSDVQDGENCSSRIPVLEAREGSYDSELSDNESLRERYGISWTKTSIPQALLEIAEHFKPAVN